MGWRQLANYTPGFANSDVSLNFDEASVLFTYTVSRDNVQALEHLDSASFYCVESTDDADTGVHSET